MIESFLTQGEIVQTGCRPDDILNGFSPVDMVEYQESFADFSMCIGAQTKFDDRAGNGVTHQLVGVIDDPFAMA